MPTITQFQVGQNYTCRSACDYNCVWTYKITARTAKTVTIAGNGKGGRRKVRLFNGVEHIDPMGRYSMSPILSASGMA